MANNPNQTKGNHGRFVKSIRRGDFHDAFKACFCKDEIENLTKILKRIALDEKHKYQVRSIFFILDRLSKGQEETKPEPLFKPLED
jgi:hypothetical protein